MHTGIHTVWQADIQADRNTPQTYIQTGMHTHTYTNAHIQRAQTYREAAGRADIQSARTCRPTGGHAGILGSRPPPIQTGIHTDTHTYSQSDTHTYIQAITHPLIQWHTYRHIYREAATQQVSPIYRHAGGGGRERHRDRDDRIYRDRYRYSLADWRTGRQAEWQAGRPTYRDIKTY